MEMVIHKPILIKENNKVKIQAKIDYPEWDKGEKFLWYEVDKRYGEYLTTDRADAFLVALLPFAMVHSSPQDRLKLVVEQEISEKLYYTITQYYIPILAKNSKRYSLIDIICPSTSKIIENAHAVGTGVSGGVDSTYTVLSHLNTPPSHKLTHGIFCSVGSFGAFGSQEEQLQINNAETICKMHKLDFVCIASNLCIDFYREVHDAIVSTFFMSFPLVLQNLFSVYLLSSAYFFDGLVFKEYSMPSFDILSILCLSTESITFYSSGCEMTRLEKVKYISEFNEPRSYLMVCGHPHLNGMQCGKCSKCTRTMLELYVIDKLENYNKVFDINDFHKNINDHLGYIIMKRKKDVFAKELLQALRDRHQHIPIGAWIAAFKKWAKHDFKSENPHHYNYLP